MFWKKSAPKPESAQRADELWKQGAQLLEKRKTAQAIATMQQALELEPSRLEGRLNLGAALYLDKRYEEAVKHLRYVLAFDRQNSMAMLNLAACYDALGRADDSLVLLGDIVRDRPTWKDAHYNLGVALYKQKMYDEAIAALRGELNINPKHEAARDLLNKIHLLPSRARAEARAQMDAAPTENPNTTQQDETSSTEQ